MRSIGDEQWRRHRRQHDLPAPSDGGGADDPERACAAAEALVAIQRLFASDAAALKVIIGLISGMRAEDGSLLIHSGTESSNPPPSREESVANSIWAKALCR